MSQSDESLIIEFLASFPNLFVSPAEVCKRAGGRNRFNSDPQWARPILLRLEQEGAVESDVHRHVRLKLDAAALKKYDFAKVHRKRIQQERVKTYVLNMTGADDDKPFPQMLREIVTQSFRHDEPEPEPKKSG